MSFKDNFHVEVSVFQGLGVGVFPLAIMSIIPGLILPYETFGDHNLLIICH